MMDEETRRKMPSMCVECVHFELSRIVTERGLCQQSPEKRLVINPSMRRHDGRGIIVESCPRYRDYCVQM